MKHIAHFYRVFRTCEDSFLTITCDMSETLEFAVKVLYYMVVHSKTVFSSSLSLSWETSALIITFDAADQSQGVFFFFFFSRHVIKRDPETWPRPENAVLYPDVGALFSGRHHPIRWILSVPRDLYGETSPLGDVMRPEREICMWCTSRLLGQNNHKFLQVEEVEGSSLSRTSTPGPFKWTSDLLGIFFFVFFCFTVGPTNDWSNPCMLWNFFFHFQNFASFM